MALFFFRFASSVPTGRPRRAIASLLHGLVLLGVTTPVATWGIEAQPPPDTEETGIVERLIADKEDLLRQNRRMREEVGDLQSKLEAYAPYTESLLADKEDLLGQTRRMREEILDLQARLDQQAAYIALLEEYKLPSSGRLMRNGYEIVALNNPLLEAQSRIRRIKKGATDLRHLWDELKPFAFTYRQFGDERDLAVGAMLTVGAFFDWGNPPPHDQAPGCVSNNVDRGFVPVEALTFKMHMQSDTGCCTDFAMMLGSFLHHLGLERNVLINPAHQCIQVRLNGSWHILDAATLVFVQDYFQGPAKTIYHFPTYRPSRVFAFTNLFIKALAFEHEPYRKEDWSVVPCAENNIAYRAPYLNVEAATAARAAR